MRYLILFVIFFSRQLTAQQVLTFQNQLNLIPEGIAIHPANGTIYISSIEKKKIVALTENGTATDFIQEGQDGFLQGLGMKVDTKRNLLWALSNIRSSNDFISHIHAFDLDSGKTVHHLEVKDTLPRLLNDVVIDNSGVLFITDTHHSTIYKFDPDVRKLEVFVHDTTKMKWPNGIAFLDEKNLVVASYGNGIVRINIDSKGIQPLMGYQDRSIAFGLDGIVANGNELYGVYNGGNGYATNAIVKYTLDESRQRIISETIMDRGNPAFADPTTAAKFGNKLYVIANSHLTQFNKNKETVVGIEKLLMPLKLVVYKL